MSKGTSRSPSEIMIIRHGEKVNDPKKDDDAGRHLSVMGSARATALPSLFAEARSPLSCEFYADEPDFVADYETIPSKAKKPRFLTPNFIFATKHSKHSNRPVETVTPVATALGLPINNRFDNKDKDIEKMTNAILTENQFVGKVVLICWHHGQIPDVAKALGIKRPPKWDGKVFDRVWRITFPKGKAQLEDLPQMLLYGDSKK